MSRLRQWPHDGKLAREENRELRAMLNANEGGGLRWADNFAPLITFRYDGDSVPIDVSAGDTVPLAVLCLRAVRRDDQTQRESGARVAWSYSGTTLRVYAIDLTSSTAEYDVTLGLLMG